MYAIDLDELIKINKIPDVSNIEVGQLIFVPKAPVNIKPAPMPQSYKNEDFMLPLKGKIITTFGQTQNNMINKGLNIQPYKNTDVYASRSGRVSFYNSNFLSFGKTIIIDHQDGFSSVYARNKEVWVKPGEFVSKGTRISSAGSTEKDSNIYLHFEIRKGHLPQNPFFYLSD